MKLFERIESGTRENMEGAVLRLRPAPYQFLALGLALIWMFLGIAKLTESRVFLSYLEDRFSLSTHVARATGWTLIASEILLGALLLYSLVRRALYLSLAALYTSMIVTLAIVLELIAVGPPERPCGCFGSAIEATYHSRLVIASAIMFVSATLIIDAGRGSGEGGWSDD